MSDGTEFSGGAAAKEDEQVLISRSELEECLKAVWDAQGYLNTIEQLNLEKLDLIHEIYLQKLRYEKRIRDLVGVPDGDDIKKSSAEFQMKLAGVSQSERCKMNNERAELRRDIEHEYGGKKIIFAAPVGSGGGINVLVTEAAAMRRCGIDASFLNVSSLKNDFPEAYTSRGVPVTFAENFDATLESIGADADCICATSCNSVYARAFGTLGKSAREISFMYYVQDYEAYFFEEGTSEYENAKASYTLLPCMRKVTKTEWNRRTVKRETGEDCTIIGPSIDIDMFEPEYEYFKDKGRLVITAMVRPCTSWRAPGLTMEVLERVFAKYGRQLEIHIFGYSEICESEFLISAHTDFEFIGHDRTSSDETAAILKASDIFVDFSSFQAMGLTAMEAMASGCAVIVPANGGADSYAKDGVNALVIDTSDIGNCESALSELIEDSELRERLTLQAVQDICAYYPEKCVKGFLDVAFAESGADKL